MTEGYHIIKKVCFFNKIVFDKVYCMIYNQIIKQKFIVKINNERKHEK